MAELKLPKWLVDAIAERVLAAPAVEVCGLVGAREGEPVSHYPISNVSPDPRIRYEMDPAELIGTFRTMREAGESLFAIYHSHPSGPLSPSPTDIAEAAYPEAIHLIAGPRQGRIELAAYRIDGDGVTQLRLA